MALERLFDILPYQAAHYPQAIALADWQGEGYTTGQCLEIIDQLSAGLIKIGIKKAENVTILAHCGSPTWNFFDLALQQIGAVVVPIHSNVAEIQLSYILKETNTQTVVVSNFALYHKIKSQKNDNIKNIICFEENTEVAFWKDLLTDSKAFLEEITQRKAAITEHDLATIVYTSGTTGEPKGVMLTHRNIMSNLKATIALLPVNNRHTVLSFLPLSHVFERMVTYCYLAVGASIWYVRSVADLPIALKEIRPHYFAAVPRFLEKIYEKLEEKISRQNKILQKIGRWALSLGGRYTGLRGQPIGYKIKLWVADFLVFRYWRKALGGRVKGIVVGAAALQPRLGRFFSAAQIRIREGYGLTETSPVIAFNRFEPGGTRFGTVGIALPGVELKINNPNGDGVGEIWVKSPGVMQGYYQKEEETALVLDADGWFRTGDVGKIVFKRFLQITDRQKDIFKTTSGRYVAPQVIENHFKSSPFIEQCLVGGANRSYVVALVVPSFVRLQAWCEAHNVHWTAPQFMVINPKVIRFMNSLLDELNAELSNHERVKKIHLLYEEWTVENGDLTPTLKPRRSVITKKYENEINEMYE